MFDNLDDSLQYLLHLIAVDDFKQLTDNSYQRTLTNAENIRVATATQMTSVDAKLAALEEKIERVTNFFSLGGIWTWLK